MLWKPYLFVALKYNVNVRIKRGKHGEVWLWMEDHFFLYIYKEEGALKGYRKIERQKYDGVNKK